MLRRTLISLAILAAAVSLAAFGGGLRGMSDGGLRLSAEIADNLAGFGDGGLRLNDDGSTGMGDGGLRGMGDGGLY